MTRILRMETDVTIHASLRNPGTVKFLKAFLVAIPFAQMEFWRSKCGRSVMTGIRIEGMDVLNVR